MPAFFARLDVEDGVRPALALAQARVHAQQHLRPVLRLGAAGAGVDGDHGAEMVVVAGEQALELEVVDARLEEDELLLDRVERRRVVLAAGEVEEVLEIGAGPGRPLESLHDAARRLELADHRLGVVRAIPETRCAHLCFEFRHLRLARGEVKDSRGADRGFPRSGPGGVPGPVR